MKNKILILTLFFALTTNVFATSPNDREIDNIQNLSGGSSLAVPSVGTTFATDTNTLTLSGKTLTSPTINSGALSGTFTGSPTLSGALSLTGGPAISGAGSLSSAMDFVDSSDSTKKLIFSLSSMTTGKSLTLSSSQTNSESLSIPNVGSGDSLATLLATQTFGSGSTWNGAAIGSAYGGTGNTSTPSNGQLDIGNGSGFTRATLTQGSGITITNGSGTITIAASAMGPTINNSAASPDSVTAAAGVVLSTPSTFNVVFVKGNTASSTTTVTATPSITACTAAGQELKIISESATALITLQNAADLSGSQLLMNGPWTSGENSGSPYTISFVCDGAATPSWVEVARNN
jgi:hypothetical protein